MKKKNLPESININSEIIEQFIEEARELLYTFERDLLLLEKNSDSKDLINSAFRAIHSLKGNAGYLDYSDIIDVCHASETFLDQVRSDKNNISQNKLTVLFKTIDALNRALENLSNDKPPVISSKTSLLKLMQETFEEAESEIKTQKDTQSESLAEVKKELLNKNKSDDGYIRVNIKKLNNLMDIVGEIVISEAMVSQHQDIINKSDSDFEKLVRNHQKNIRELQEIANSIRMVPLNWLFNKLNRIVRDLAARENKEINFIINGGETEMDRSIIENISDPLVHILRNAIDHGIEIPEDRKKSGKPLKGKIELSARRIAGEIWIEIEDDGKGLNKNAIFENAIKKGIVSLSKNDLTEGQIYNLILATGLSTADKITDVSGRGVGMDVVARNLEKIRGRIEIESSENNGTKFTLKIPITTAIIDGMLMRVKDAIYSIPTQDIKESIDVSNSTIIKLSKGREIIHLRNHVLPVLRLNQFHNINSENSEKGVVVVAEHNATMIGIFVDEIIGQKQMVFKSLSNYVENISGVSGCAVLGSGEISLILDLPNLIKMTNHKMVTN